jgi:hypothetical protein
VAAISPYLIRASCRRWREIAHAPIHFRPTQRRRATIRVSSPVSSRFTTSSTPRKVYISEARESDAHLEPVTFNDSQTLSLTRSPRLLQEFAGTLCQLHSLSFFNTMALPLDVRIPARWLLYFLVCFSTLIDAFYIPGLSACFCSWR